MRAVLLFSNKKNGFPIKQSQFVNGIDQHENVNTRWVYFLKIEFKILETALSIVDTLPLPWAAFKGL